MAKKLSEFGTTVPKYFLIISGWSFTASEKEQKITPSSFNFSLKVVPSDTLSTVSYTHLRAHET